MNAPSLRRLVLAWISLLILLVLSCGSALIHLGVWNAVANYGIAAAKAAIVIVVFMHLGAGLGMLRIAAAAGVIALAILGGLSATDFLMRGVP